MPTTQAQAQPTEGTIWIRVIQPAKGDLAQDAARGILSLNFGEEDRGRMRDLAERNNEGQLSPAEREELANYVKVGDILSLLHLKAKKSLTATGTNGAG